MAKIYISSTFEDLKDFRAAAYHRLRQMRHDVISMEDYTAGDRRPLDQCLADVAACELYVGIFAWRYGYIPDQQNNERRSITELEYRKATQEGKPRLIFLLDPDATWQPRWMDFRSGEGERGRRIEALREELRREHTIRYFSSPEGLSGELSVAVNELQQQWIAAGIAEQRREMAKESERRGSRVRQRVVGQHVLDVGEHFQGRIRERKELGTCLAEPSTRMVSILGRAGIGKTALASKVLGDLEHNGWPQNDRGVDGIVYLSTRTCGVTLECLFTHCATALGSDREQALHATWANSQLTVAEKIERLLIALDEGVYVILLDHMEDLLDDRGAITDPDLKAFFDLSLAAPHGARLLVTSRAPITFNPERTRFDRRIPLVSGLSAAEGMAMLRDMDPNGTWGLRELPEDEVARAVERLYGIPRALEWLGGLLKDEYLSSPTEILDRFGDDVVDDLMKEAYRRLGDEERRVMEALAVLGRPVPLIAVQFVVTGFDPGLSVDAVLRRLIDVHMVTLDRRSRTVALNPIDQDYVYHRLVEDGDYSRKALDRRAAEYYEQLQVPRPGWQSAVDLDPYLLEYEHRFRAGQYEAAAGVLNRLDFEFAAWRTHARRLQAMLQRLDGKLHQRYLQMLQYYNLGLTYAFLGPLEKAAECFESAYSMAREIGNREYERKATAWVGEASRRLGDLDRAIEHLESAVALDPAGAAPRDTHLMLLGLAYAYKRDFRQAVDCGVRLLDFGASHSDAILSAQGHDVLSLAYLGLRDFAQVFVHTRLAVELYRSADARDPLAYVLNVEGMAYLGQGRIDEAIESFERARLRGREDDSPRLEGFSLFNLARARRMKGERDRAREMAASSEAVLARIGAPEAAAAAAFHAALNAAVTETTAIARALLTCARCCLFTADLLDPRDLLAEAEAIAPELAGETAEVLAQIGSRAAAGPE